MKLWPRLGIGDLTERLVVIGSACPECHAGQGEHCRFKAPPPRRNAVHEKRWARAQAIGQREEVEVSA